MSETPGIKFNNCPCAACLVNACRTDHGCECNKNKSHDSLKLKAGGSLPIEIPELKKLQAENETLKERIKELESHTIVLSEEDRKKFIEALENPPNPNPALKKLMSGTYSPIYIDTQGRILKYCPDCDKEYIGDETEQLKEELEDAHGKIDELEGYAEHLRHTKDLAGNYVLAKLNYGEEAISEAFEELRKDL